jgi:hypothetical protein
MEIVKGETWRDKGEEILGEERATLLGSDNPKVTKQSLVPLWTRYFYYRPGQ